MPIEISPGLVVDTVGDLIDPVTGEVTVQPLLPPTLEGAPAFPEPGIYFGMPEDLYHTIHACSASGLKALSSSATYYWANSVLNPEREDEDTVGKALGRAYHVRICEGREEFLRRFAIALDKADYDDLCVTVDDIRKAIDAAGGKPKGTAKGPLIEQLLDFDPEANVWDKLCAEHLAANEGKTLIDLTAAKRIEVAARMIENDPQLGDAFRQGHAEVSLFWFDKHTGTPMKARLDYLRLLHLVDLKSFANAQGKPVQRAIDAAISNYKYYIPVVVYLEGIERVKELVRETKGKCIPSDYADDAEAFDAAYRWAWQWAHQPEPEVLFVFQQTGIAPVTRGRIMGKGTTFEVTNYAVQSLKKKWRECAETYGTDIWLDIEGVTRTEDESLTWAATDFGEVQYG